MQLRRVVFTLILIACFSLPAASVENTGGWRLAAESSPYLNMHAGNPVEWYPWGEEAFAKARRENKPLFISIGYFTCHWCHVMARESFENPEIAKLLNEHFVALKVDREQRPDIDDAYMRYINLTRGHGGWPMSVWATPDGEPFTGGTYFPAEDRQGKPGMKSLLTRLAGMWKDDEANIRKVAAQAVAAMRELEGGARSSKTLARELPLRAQEELAAEFDELQGGFGPAPKFPRPASLLFLLESPQQGGADMALATLDHMAAGGIHDQLAGGFHRYSTDFEWRVPHFEKMLYDQALIAHAYLSAWQRTEAEQYSAIVRKTLDFSLASMRDARGGFYSALAADSPPTGQPAGPMEEGAYYTWDWQQLGAALGDVGLLNWAAARYGVREGGNSVSDARGDIGRRNVLYAALDEKGLAAKFGVDLITVKQRNARVEELLLKARAQRPAVPVDDKVVAAWNGYMLSTLALAGQLLKEPRYIEAAQQTAAFLLDNLYDVERGVLYRDWRNGVPGAPGFGEDYAAVAGGLLALYMATREKHWLVQAQALVDHLLAGYRDETAGGFFNAPADTDLWVREKPVIDGTTLSLNGMAVHVLLDLAPLAGNDAYRDRAWKTAAWAGAQMAESPSFMPYILMAWPRLLAPAGQP